MDFPILTPQEAAQFILHGDTLGLSGFSPSGTPKSVVPFIADKARKEHEAGREYKLHLIAGASTGDSQDGVLTRADAVIDRTPFCTDADMRAAYNNGQLDFVDLNLSDTAAFMRQGHTHIPTWALVEAVHLEVKGDVCRIFLTTGVGIAPTICRLAEKGVLVELNSWHDSAIIGLHDIYEIGNAWERSVVDIKHPLDRIGKPYIEVPVERIKGVIKCNLPDEYRAMTAPSEITDAIGAHVAAFVKWNIKRGVLKAQNLIFQSGVGVGANAVMGAMGKDVEIPDFSIYTEVFQDALMDLMRQGRIKCASTGALPLAPDSLKQLYQEIDLYRDKLVVRPSEISNCPEVITRLGICAMNTALEVDVYGHVNSTKICGSQMMNGVGGSSDYTTSSALSVFTCASTARKGSISSIVPFCSHIDHTEHHVDAIVTEYGVADLRGKSPRQRMEMLIEIAHPDYRPILREYRRIAEKVGGHTPHLLTAAFAMHDTYLRKGDMRLVDWGEYIK